MDLEELEDFMDFSLFAYLGYAAYKALKTKKASKTKQAFKTKEASKRKEIRPESLRWIRELNLTKDVDGFYSVNYKTMQERDPQQFYKVTRMKSQTFELLLSLIEPELEKTSWRKPVSPSCRLFMVLLYLSHGVPKPVLASIFQMGCTTVAEIIYQTCDILWTKLMPLYLSPPSEENWKQIARDFNKLWNLPNCVSAVDGKYINIRYPSRAGSEFVNCKGHQSIVLLAACDANYTFTAVDIGANCSQSGGGIFSESSFGKKLLKGELNLPPSTLLPSSDIVFNHYLVGNAAFPLKTYLMRPYPGRLLDDQRLNFNKRLSRAQRVIENAFGILIAKWRILQTTLNMLPDNAERVVKASVVLHNFVKLNDSTYYSQEYVDVFDENDETVHRGLWRNGTESLLPVKPLGSNFSSGLAFKMRDALNDYLSKS